MEIQISNLYDEQAEQALLGAILQKNEILKILTIDFDQFYFPKHQTIFKALRSMNDDGIEVDTVTLCSKLTELKQLERVGGAYFLTGLLDQCPAPSMAPTYARQIIN